MNTDVFIDAIEALAEATPSTKLPADLEQLDRLVQATSRIVLWEFQGLADRIRAGVNGTPRPVPTRPAPPPPPPPSNPPAED